jgi:Kdo2-lipid IVA lauroyltransferase/acyltransferase
MFYLCPMQLLGFWLARGFFGLFRLVPFSLLYKMSEGLARLLFGFGYRKAVVYGNLRRCFPEKTEAEITEIAKGAYLNLADVTLETLKGNVTPVSKIGGRYTYPNPEVLNAYLDTGRSIILVGAHYNNWEWSVLTIADKLRGHAIAVYKPLSNPHMDRWLWKKRTRAGTKMVGMKDTHATVVQYQKEPSVYILGSDQSPSNRKTAQWVDFFGQKTACLPGADFIARKYDYPVFYFDIQRVARGRYEMWFREVCLEPAQTEAPMITQLFMKKFEDQIRDRPENWLWSHRRWKMQDE